MDSNGKEVCQRCLGWKTVIDTSFKLETICGECKGNGERDWVSHARNEWGSANGDVLIQMTKHNIAMLTRELHRQYDLLNLDINIEVTESRRYRTSSIIDPKFYNFL